MLHAPAIAHLEAADPAIAAVIRAVGPCTLTIASGGSHFEAVARSIVFQQLSGRAASTIHGRFRALYRVDLPDGPTPAAVLATDEATLRAVGLSRQKIASVRDLAERVHAGDVPLEGIDALDDEAVVAALSRVRGVGRWTAQMFLIFRLGRPDVLPTLDLGIQRAVQLLHGLPSLAAPLDVAHAAAPWAPWRSVATWYLWRWLDGEAGGTLA